MISTFVGRLRVKSPKPSERESLSPESDIQMSKYNLKCPVKYCHKKYSNGSAEQLTVMIQANIIPFD